MLICNICNEVWKVSYVRVCVCVGMCFHGIRPQGVETRFLYCYIFRKRMKSREMRYELVSGIYNQRNRLQRKKPENLTWSHARKRLVRGWIVTPACVFIDQFRSWGFLKICMKLDKLCDPLFEQICTKIEIDKC